MLNIMLNFDCFIRVYLLVSKILWSRLFYLVQHTTSSTNSIYGECSIKVYVTGFAKTDRIAVK